jgi:hypothetical protein
MQESTTDEETTYELVHHDLSDNPHGSMTVDSWDDAMDVIDEPFDHFSKVIGQVTLFGPTQEFVGIKENRHENFRFDIMVESAGDNGFITQNSYITVREVTDE